MGTVAVELFHNGNQAPQPNKRLVRTHLVSAGELRNFGCQSFEYFQQLTPVRISYVVRLPTGRASMGELLSMNSEKSTKNRKRRTRFWVVLPLATLVAVSGTFTASAQPSSEIPTTGQTSPSVTSETSSTPTPSMPAPVSSTPTGSSPSQPSPSPQETTTSPQPASPTPSGPEEAPAVTETVLRLPHPLSVEDALSLRQSLPVVGLQYSVIGAAGGVSVSPEQSDADVAEQLRIATEPYGFDPAITDVVVSSSTSVPPGDAGARRAPAPEASADPEGLQQQLDALGSALPESETTGTPVQPELGAAPAAASTGPSARAQSQAQAAEDNAPWSPAYANSTAWEFESGVSTMRHDLVWNGTTQYPWSIIDDFGLELSDKQKNRNLQSFGGRPYTCTDPSFNTGYWAKRTSSYGYLSWNILIPSNNPDTYRSYADTSNDSDACNEMEMAVGIGYPNRLRSYGPEFRIFTEVRAPRGNDAGTEVNSDLQAPSNDCNNVGLEPATTCMGLNVKRGYGGVALLRGVGDNKSFPGSWHWPFSTGLAEWEKQKCASYGAIGTAYRRNNAASGPLGACQVWEYPGPRNGRQQNYSNGRIYYHPNTNAFAVFGAIFTMYANTQEANGPLKYPTSDEVSCPTRANCKFNRFETGNIYWSPTTGAHEVHGAIFGEYGRQGYERGRFGLPTSGEFGTTDKQVNFEGGWIRWIAATNRIITS